MAERPWHDQWIKRDPNGPPPKRERGAPGSGSGWGWALLGAGALARMAYEALWDRNRRWETHWEERQFETRQQNQAWKHREDSATARGGGRFKNMHVNPDAEEFHQRAAERDYARGRRVLPEQSTATAPNTPPSSSGRVGGRSAQEWAEFDVRMRAREAATEAEMWADDPEGMARQARERAAATGEPLDPRAQRGLVRRGAGSVEAPGGAPSGPSAGGALTAEPGIDLEGMKRARPTGEPVSWKGMGAGAARVAGRVANGVFAVWETYKFAKGVEDKGGWSAGNVAKQYGERYVEALKDYYGAPGRILDFWGGVGRRLSGAKAPVPGGDPRSEEEVRAQYSENSGDERAPAVGGMGEGFAPQLHDGPNPYVGAGGWGDSGEPKKKGRPMKDPYGIGQGRLQAERDIAEQKKAEERNERTRNRDEKKAEDYIAYIEKEDRKNERARLARERRQIDFENDSDWLAQLKAWDEKSVEGGRGRGRSIKANAWQAAGAVVGGFSQINVELVRSEIERALERGDTAIRMN